MNNGKRDRRFRLEKTMPGKIRSTEATMSRADIAVIGAGAAGLAAALAFARDGRDTILIGEAGSRRDGRTVAMLSGTVRLLEELGVWDRLSPHTAPLAIMRLFDDTGSLFRLPPVEFRASEIGLEAFGYNIENATLVEGLREAARAEPSLRWIEADIATPPRAGEAGWTVEAGGEAVHARLIVGADGRNSPTRAAAGIGTRPWTYPQAALTTILAHTRPHREVSTEFHTREGPFTLVPLPGNRSSLVWMMETGKAQELASLPDEALARRIERQARSILGAMRIDGPRGVVPMGGLSVDRFTAERVALVGEAAHVFPPIGAQGLNLGFRDVSGIVEAVRGHADPGDPAVLAAYERGRGFDVRTRTFAVDALNRSLLSPFLPIDLARGAGLLALDRIGPLRRAVMRQGLAPGL